MGTSRVDRSTSMVECFCCCLILSVQTEFCQSNQIHLLSTSHHDGKPRGTAAHVHFRRYSMYTNQKLTQLTRLLELNYKCESHTKQSLGSMCKCLHACALHTGMHPQPKHASRARRSAAKAHVQHAWVCCESGCAACMGLIRRPGLTHNKKTSCNMCTEHTPTVAASHVRMWQRVDAYRSDAGHVSHVDMEICRHASVARTLQNRCPRSPQVPFAAASCV